ncbi:MAG: TRAP transporter TatT component family protein [Pseudomonadota bacterium]
MTGALLIAVFFSTGCSLERMAVNALADALSAHGSSFASDDDIELVGAATPFGLKTLESLLERAPDHQGLLLAGASGFTQYAYVYVQEPMERVLETDFEMAEEMGERASRLYRRARGYGLRGLRIEEPGIDAALSADGPLSGFDRTAVPLLFWTAAAWGAEVGLNADDPFLVGEFPAVAKLIERAYALEPAWNSGAIHAFLIGFSVSRPDREPDAFDQARWHFDQSIALSDGGLAAPYVSLAENVSVQMENKDEFVGLLEQALAIDLDVRPNDRLANRIAQRRARWLLSRIDEYFSE